MIYYINKKKCCEFDKIIIILYILTKTPAIFRTYHVVPHFPPDYSFSDWSVFSASLFFFCLFIFQSTFFEVPSIFLLCIFYYSFSNANKTRAALLLPFLRRKSLTFLKDGSSDSRHCISFPYLFHQPKEYRVLKQQRKSCPRKDSFSLPFHMAAAIPKYFKHDSD